MNKGLIYFKLCLLFFLFLDLAANSQTPLYNTENDLDVFEFPKGYFLGTNNYFKCNKSVDQLKAYPVPRFMPYVKMHRNVNWIKSMWMADIINQNALQPIEQYKIVDAVAIQNELSENWNYYYNFSENVSRSYNMLEDKNIMTNAAFINDINTSGKNYPLACLTYRRQLDVTVLQTPENNFSQCENILLRKGDQRSLIICQQLENINPQPPCSYPVGSVYPRDKSGNKISPSQNSPNSWSPLKANRSIYLGDAMALETALDKFINTGKFHLTENAIKRIEMISENNEVAPRYSLKPDGHNRLEDDKAIFDAAKAAPFLGNMDYYQGEAKKAIDNDYRDYILNSKRLRLPISTGFLNYTVSGFGNKHLYQQLRETQKLIDGKCYPTPDIYISRPHLWKEQSKGANNGWQWFAISRYKEIYDDGFGHAYNDQWCAPFVSAGYNTNMEFNTRPGQYLGFLKAMVLQGAEFFHPFVENNIRQGNAFCWQAAIPVYAQAVGSRLYHFIEYGKSLFGDIPITLKNMKGTIPSFRFKSDNENYLIAVRQDTDEKLGAINRFAIVGAIMKNSNGINDSPLSSNATFTLGNQQLTFPIRRQGSTYVYDYSDKGNIVFYQLDKWHQYEHPDYWSKDFEIEAEVFDNTTSNNAWKVKSEGIVISGVKVDLTNVTSYIHFKVVPSSPIIYIFQPRKDGVKNDYALWILARSSVKSGIDIVLSSELGKVSNHINNIDSKEWKWYEVTPNTNTFIGLSDNDVRYELQLLPINNSVEIDAIKIVAPKN